jgi:hypothetical protein
MKIVKKEKEK